MQRKVGHLLLSLDLSLRRYPTTGFRGTGFRGGGRGAGPVELLGGAVQGDGEQNGRL